MRRVGRELVDKKVTSWLNCMLWGLIIVFRFRVHIFYEPIRACVDEDGQ